MLEVWRRMFIDHESAASFTVVEGLAESVI
jgi:hypothetical protein